jgi:hypothetical protein
MKKNIFLLFLALCSFSAIHAEVKWNLSSDGTLTISGNGDMIDDSWVPQSDKIKKVIITDGVTNIMSRAFYECKNLTSVTIGNSVKSIGDCAFSDCTNLTSVTIPNSVESIGREAFHWCIDLTSVTIGNSVKSIEQNAFRGCTSLESITFNGNKAPTIETDAFKNVDNSIPVYVPFKSMSAYKKALGDFSNIQALSISLTDDQGYTYGLQLQAKEVSYTRDFTNVNWQAIYLPFSLKYEDLKDDFELAYINTVRQYDRDKDGVIDETAMEIVKMKSGSTAPNRPYLIRAKSKGEKTITVKDATVSASENKGVDCSTTIAKFTITGTYKPIPSETMIANNYYAMGGGKLIHSDGSNGLKPYRWYMKVEARDYSKYKVSNAAKAITIKVLDDEKTTGIDELRTASSNSSVYDINGRKVNENSLKPGMYIKNGRKFVVK